MKLLLALLCLIIAVLAYYFDGSEILQVIFKTEDAAEVFDPCRDPDPTFLTGTFPKEFIWSTATASYQTEGAWDTNGKGPSIWDEFTHKHPELIADGSNGDIACDSYHHSADDVKLLKDLGVSQYRFSLSWPRLVPTGLVADGVNPDGIRFYSQLIRNLLDNDIQPMITLYHWDLPQALQDQGGWLNGSSIHWFLDYADLCFRLFASNVSHWITFNDPVMVAWENNGFGSQASDCPGTCPYQIMHNIIKAHATVWRHFSKFYSTSQKEKVGIVLGATHVLAGRNQKSDEDAAERHREFTIGWVANPMFGDGDYPTVMKEIVGNRSVAEGLKYSRLPEFSPSEKALIKGACDFIGLNIYTSVVVYSALNDPRQVSAPSWAADQQVQTTQCRSWVSSGSSWLKATPWGLRGVLNWIRTHYNNPLVLITENGWSDQTGTIEDDQRVEVLRQSINNVLKAIADGCNVGGYTVWSLLDNFEWLQGYTERFGIHYVNFDDPKRPRVPKKSARFFAKMISDNGFT